MKIDLQNLNWTLAGYSPVSWRMGRTLEQALDCIPEIAPVPARVPGSVQHALLDAGVLPDWNKKLSSFACEWVEHRDWIFAVEIPRADFESGSCRHLCCLGLDGYGLVLFNGVDVGSFQNGYVPHRFDLSAVPLRDTNTLEIIFNGLPRFNGTPNISSEIRDLKARFNYSWDWMPRNVQIGIWGAVFLEIDHAGALDNMRISVDYDTALHTGRLELQGGELADSQTLRVVIEGVDQWQVSAAMLAEGAHFDGLAVEPWECNGEGIPRLYDMQLEILDAAGAVQASRTEKIGFKQVRWLPCAGAPEEADPWICELNGRKIFLVGVNWTPIRAHYADVSTEDYRVRLEAYRDIGFNVLRVWGGAFLEKEIFYQLCDELGLMVWQEFPLSSSGPDNAPPTDAATVGLFGEVARSYIRRRRHHASLILWCGGNELQTAADGSPGIGRPLDPSHPMLARFAQICREEDPTRRYLPCSSSGPKFLADEKDFGRGVHWDVHGPWRMPGKNKAEAQQYWNRDDALFRSEAGAPGCSPLEILDEYYPDCELMPVRADNPYWRRCYWWIDEDVFIAEHGRPPASLAEYVTWSQNHQSEALTMALAACLKRFPAIGGLIFWMGHDSFPCLANTSVIDFHGRPKPAALAIRQLLEEHRSNSSAELPGRQSPDTSGSIGGR